MSTPNGSVAAAVLELPTEEKRDVVSDAIKSLPDAQTSDAVRRMATAAHSPGVTARTLNRLAVLLAARAPETVFKLEDVDDELAVELARRVLQAGALGWDDEALAGMVEKALRSERHRTPVQRRKAFRDHLDRLATERQARDADAAPEAA